LIKSARLGAAERGIQSTLPAELVRTVLQKISASMQEDDDPDTLKDAATGLAECIKNAGPGMLSAQEVVQLVQQLFKFMDDSFERSSALEKAQKQNELDAPQELQKDEDDENSAEEDEEECRRKLEEAVGAVMKAAPTEFLQCLPECGKRMSQWLPTKQNRVLALWLACDLIEHLKGQSESVWPVFMPGVFQALHDEDPDVRVAGAYAINLAAPLDSFSEAAPEAFRKLAQIVSSPPPKKRDEKAKVAFDNAVAALLMLAKERSSLCPPEVQAWQLVIGKLPLKEDEDEAKKMHKIVADLVLAQDAGVLGTNGAHLGKLLSALAEVYQQEDICEKETDAKILSIFTLLPRENLTQLAGNFSEKQQKKIERMLTATPTVQHGG